MEYPHGHHHHSHHRREEEDEYPPPSRPGFEPHRPPPPFYEQPPPPPPHVAQVHHTSHVGGGDPYYNTPPPPREDYYGPPPPQPSHGFNYQEPAPAPYSTVQHVSHEAETNPHHHHRPHVPSFINERIHPQKPSVRVHSKAESNYSLTIRDGKVILARSDPSDPCQHWIKDEKFSTKVKDEEGFPSFALVNKATGQAIKHSVGATYPVQLTPYNPDVLDESVLWSESRDLGDGFRTIRMINNIRLNVDALNGDKNHGGVHDGTTIVLWEWKKGENQRWKITPY